MRDSQSFIESMEVGTLARAIVDTVREPLLVLDKDLRVISASRSFYNTFKVSPQETNGHLLYDLGEGQWDIPALRVLLENILPKSAFLEDYEVEHDFPDIGRRIVLLNARTIICGRDTSPTFLLAFSDVTERRAAERSLQDL